MRSTSRLSSSRRLSSPGYSTQNCCMLVPTITFLGGRSDRRWRPGSSPAQSATAAIARQHIALVMPPPSGSHCSIAGACRCEAIRAPYTGRCLSTAPLRPARSVPAACGCIPKIADVGTSCRPEAAGLTGFDSRLEIDRGGFLYHGIPLTAEVEPCLRAVKLHDLIVVRVVAHGLVADRERREVILRVFNREARRLRHLRPVEIHATAGARHCRGLARSHVPLDDIDDVRCLADEQPARVVPEVVPN